MHLFLLSKLNFHIERYIRRNNVKHEVPRNIKCVDVLSVQMPKQYKNVA